MLSGSGALISLAVFVYHIIKQYRSPLNRSTAALGLVTAALLTIVILRQLPVESLPPLTSSRLIIGILILVAIIILVVAILYPRPIYKRWAFIVLGMTPGLSMAALVLGTDLIMPAQFDPARVLDFPGYLTALATIVAYYSITIIVLLLKSIRSEYLTFRRDLRFLATGIAVLSAGSLGATAAMPMFPESAPYGVMALSVFHILLVITVNSASYLSEDVDIKKFYVEGLYWLITFVLLLIPVALIIHYRAAFLETAGIHPVVIALVIFGYLFTVFKFIRPRLENIFQRGYRNLADKLTDLFGPITQTSIADDAKKFWDLFFLSLIDGLLDKFGITRASFFIVNTRDRHYLPAYTSDVPIQGLPIPESSPVIACLHEHHAIVYRPDVYHFPAFDRFRSELFGFFLRMKMEIIIPFYNPSNELIGFLLLGPMIRKNIYSRTLLSILELYRIQFQHQLSNALMLENVRSTQSLEHDRMVVETVKRKIIPESIEQVPGIRVSSLFINNSQWGGDYFDAVHQVNDTLSLFIADSSYHGIDSILISLEMYSVLHTGTRYFESPDRILSTMNWTISTAQFTNKYARAMCVTYSRTDGLHCSGASHNPLILFNPMDGSFTEHTTEGVPLGLDRASAYTEKSIKADPGSIGMLHSDGLISSLNDQGENYPLDRIQNILRRDREQSPAVITRNVYLDYSDFIQGKKQVNDVSLIVFKI